MFSMFKKAKNIEKYRITPVIKTVIHEKSYKNNKNLVYYFLIGLQKANNIK